MQYTNETVTVIVGYNTLILREFSGTVEYRVGGSEARYLANYSNWRSVEIVHEDETREYALELAEKYNYAILSAKGTSKLLGMEVSKHSIRISPEGKKAFDLPLEMDAEYAVSITLGLPPGLTA